MGRGECAWSCNGSRRGSAGDVAGAPLPRVAHDRRLHLPALIKGAPSAGHSEALYSTNLLNKIRLARFSFLISFELFYFDNLVGQSYNAMGAYLSNASKHPTPLLIMQARRKHTIQCT